MVGYSVLLMRGVYREKSARLHFVLNPDGSDVQALQQNGVQTLLILIGVFGLATLALWLLLPFRLERRKATGS